VVELPIRLVHDLDRGLLARRVSDGRKTEQGEAHHGHAAQHGYLLHV
jgi:hypothetical protein